MNFFKTFLASFLAVGLVVFLALFFVFTAFVGLIMSAGSAQDEAVAIRPNTVLEIELNNIIVENAKSDPFEFDFGEMMPLPIQASSSKTGLYQITRAIKHAKNNENIDGIYLKPGMMLSAGWASLKTIRDALVDFKGSGKFIYAYGEVFTEQAYYLVSVADSIYMPKSGIMEFNGLTSSRMFYKNMFDKLELEPLVFKVGTFKSAVEPYIQSKMSEASKAQTEEYLGDIWDLIANDIATSRSLSVEEVNRIANEFIMNEAPAAKDAGLIDEAVYESDFMSILKEKMGQGEDEKLRSVSLKKFMKVPQDRPSSTNKIAVIFAEGTIQMGKSGDDIAGSETLTAAIRKAREDDAVKAIVLRVNSPGGQAIAADLITDEVERAAKLKPVIASMGDVAASGGYYISAKCDKIYAQENTITGSIGIFAILYDTHNTLGNKIGLTFDHVETHEHADFGNPNFPMTAAEKAFMQANTERGYTNFMTIVKDGRNFESLKEVDKIAQGRVWSGKKAIDLNLVDEIGGLDAAITDAAQLAGLGDDYLIQLMPKAKSPFEEIIEQVTMTSLQQHPLQKELKAAEQLKKHIPTSGTYALMPFMEVIE